MRQFDGLIVAHYDFTDKEGRKVKTTKLKISLDQYGVIELCSDLANDFDLLSEVKVTLGFKGNKFVIDAIN